MSDEKFKLPRSSYEELSKVIKAYGNLNSPATLGEVDQLAGVGKTNVSANNAFLLNVEIIEGTKAKGITPKGRKLALALEHNMAHEVSEAWKTIANENDFLAKMVKAVSIRNGMEISQFMNHIAYSAGEANSSYVLTGARAVVDILLASKLLKEEGDIVIQRESLEESPRSKDNLPDQKGFTPLQDVQLDRIQVSNGVYLTIELRINVGPDDLEGLGEKIRKLVDDISNGKPSTDE